jgi:non-homologous end joining protein Ku
MEILEFVKVEELDPVYFDASYYELHKTKLRRRTISF